MFSRYSHSPLTGSMNRREMLARAGLGFGSLALSMLLAEEGRLFADEHDGPQLEQPVDG